MPRGSHTDWLARAQRVVGHRFRDPQLLAQALTHPSYAVEHAGAPHYERLEFLGDAVLSLVVVEEIFRRFPDLPEGRMTKLKIALVSGPVLALVAEEVGLGDVVRLGESELADGGRGRTSALENAIEAVIGALYLDGGLESAREFVLRVLGDRVDPERIDALEHPKSALQEFLQARGQVPEYAIVSTTGPPHRRRFRAEVLLDGHVIGEGEGPSKRVAEMGAARAALDALRRAAESGQQGG